jgi:anti-sigma28 factor (negative regulator of flagellin synthesis)
MSIRVNNHDVSLTSQTGLAEQLKPTGSGESTSSVSGKATEDHIEVSAAAENINSALTAQNLQHSQKIQQLGALVAGGRYSVASGDISRAIVSTALSGTAGRE